MSQVAAIAIYSAGSNTQGVWWKSNSEFTVKLHNPIELDTSETGEWRVALKKVSYKNSRANITAAYNNNKFHYNNGTSDKVITIWDGLWNIQELNDFIRSSVAENGDNLPGDLSPITIGYNGPTLKVVISVAAGYSVTFPIGESLNENLGINAGTVITGSYLGDEQANMNRGVDYMNIICDLVDSAECVRFNGTTDDYLHTITVSGPPGATVDDEPRKMLYLPMARTANRKISQVTIKIKDAFGDDYQSRTHVVIVLAFKRFPL